MSIFGIIYLLLTIIQLLLMARIVVDFIQVFARQWRPRGAALVFATAVYKSTDPPLGWVRRIIPPLRLGGVQLDLAFIVLYFVVVILQSVVASLGVRA